MLRLRRAENGSSSSDDSEDDGPPASSSSSSKEKRKFDGQKETGKFQIIKLELNKLEDLEAS